MKRLFLHLSMVTVFAMSGCGGRDVDTDTPSRSDPATNSAAVAAGTASDKKTAEAPSGLLCVFDYDLTLSSHRCAEIKDEEAYHCRTNTCGTYDWNHQCLGLAASAAVAECVKRKAYIGIASHADVDGCWNDKVAPMVSENQFPELTASDRYGNGNEPTAYPALDSRENWNCATCAYQMAPDLSKPQAIERIMRHYAMSPERPEDRARVIFWDDSKTNIEAVSAAMPEVVSIHVPRNGRSGSDGGCGITRVQIEQAFSSGETRP